MTELELLMFFNLLVVAGSETTRNSIALGMVALIENPDQLAAAPRRPVADADRRRGDPPMDLRDHVQPEDRHHATRPSASSRSSAATKVTLWWPSANRDEEVFAEADRFDIRRTPNPHLSFGHRTHICLGATLARMEIRLVFGELLDRLEDFDLTGPVERVRTNKHAGVWRVPMSYRPRRQA